MIFYEKIQEYDNGKVTLIVNVASKCGEVDQYKELVDIQEKYKDDLQVFRLKMPFLMKITKLMIIFLDSGIPNERFWWSGTWYNRIYSQIH